MKARAWLLVAGALALLSLSLHVEAETLTGRTVRVIDGDTFVVLFHGNQEERVRLAGIDCPEQSQPFGQRAKEALLTRVGGREVVVEWEKRDRYKRLVGKISDAQGDVNLALLRDGLCWWYRKYAHEQSEVDQVLYEAAEAKAREGRVGLWRDVAPVPPWEWRKR